VIEHLHDPKAELAEVRRILKPGGLFYLLTPDVESVASKLMRRHWLEIKPPEHLFYFSKRTLTRLMNASGFRMVSARTGGKVLTFEYIASVLTRTGKWLPCLLRIALGWLPIYRRPISFPNGFLLAQGFKPAGLD